MKKCEAYNEILMHLNNLKAARKKKDIFEYLSSHNETNINSIRKWLDELISYEFLYLCDDARNPKKVKSGSTAYYAIDNNITQLLNHCSDKKKFVTTHPI